MHHGVKQGCPASPLLFGLYLDDLETRVMRSANRDSQTLPIGPTPTPHGVEDGASQVAPPLPFADDLCLTSLSMQGLQKHMNASHLQRSRPDCQLHQNKTCGFSALLCRGTAWPDICWTACRASTELQVSRTADAWHQRPLTFALSHLKAAAQRASFALLPRCTELNIRHSARAHW